MEELLRQKDKNLQSLQMEVAERENTILKLNQEVKEIEFELSVKVIDHAKN